MDKNWLVLYYVDPMTYCLVDIDKYCEGNENLNDLHEFVVTVETILNQHRDLFPRIVIEKYIPETIINGVKWLIKIERTYEDDQIMLTIYNDAGDKYPYFYIGNKYRLFNYED